MPRQLYRFLLHDEVSPGVWTGIDEADMSAVWIVEIGLDPAGRESKIAASKQLAAEHGRESFSAEQSFYITAATLQQARELRGQLEARGVLPQPVKIELPPPEPKSHALLWTGIAAAVIAIVLAAGWGLGWWSSGAAAPVPSPGPGTSSTAQTGTAAGQHSKAYQLGKSEYVQNHYAKAREDFAQSCKEGEADGCNYLAYLYDQALGGARDGEQATDIYGRLCDKGNAASCSNLGQVYENDRKNAKARIYLEKACHDGYAEACRKLPKRR